MKEQSIFGKALRFIAILLLGLTAVFHLLGGIGTTCVALFAERWDSMAAIAPYKWLYILFVLVTIVVSIYAIRAAVRYARGKPGSYRDAVVILVVALFVTAAHVIASETLRGASAPANMRLYLNILTLVVFLVFGSPVLFRSRPLGDNAASSDGSGLGAAIVLMGLTILSVQWWAGPTHTWADGVNYADVWHGQLAAAGWGLVLLGLTITLWRPLTVRKRRGLHRSFND